MNVLFIGDMHLRINKFTLALNFLRWVDKFIEEKRPDIVVNLGDALDTHAVIRSEPLNELMQHIYNTLDLGIPYVYVKGNHCQFTPKNSKYHALLPFKGRIKDLYIIDAPQDLFGMTFVPYLVDGNAFPKTTLPVCVAHQTFLGADYGPVNATEGVDANTINAELIISGHIHKKHTLGKVVYVGSPYSQDASDVNQIKGVTIFNTDTWKFEFYETPLPAWKSFKFELSSENTAQVMHKFLKESVQGSLDHWVVELTGPKAELVAYLDSTPYQKLVKGISLRLKTVFTDKEKRKISINAVSMEQIVSEYVDKVYNGSIDKNILLNQAKSILADIKSKVA